MYVAKRPLLRPAIIFFLIVPFLLVACGRGFGNTTWPGLSTDGEKVFVAYGPQVLAYDIETQSLVWSFPEERSTVQFFAAPSVADERVVFGDFGASGGFFSPGVVVSVYALEDTESGTPNTLWVDDDIATDKIVAPALQADGRVFVGTSDNYVIALDSETGALLWRFETGHSIWGQPAYRDGVLFVSSLDKTIYAINTESGEEIWQKVVTGALPSRPVLNSDLVYITGFDSQVHALNIESGEEQWAVSAEDWTWGAPTLADGVLYFTDIKGNVYAVNAATGNEIWTQPIGTRVQTSPMVADDFVYIASEDNSTEEPQGVLIALGVEDGEEIWRKTAPAPLHTTPVVVDDSVIVALQSESALLISFDRVDGTQQWVIPPPEQ